MLRGSFSYVTAHLVNTFCSCRIESMRAFRIWLFLGLISACSGDNSPADGGTDGSTNDVTTQKDSGGDVTQSTDTGTDVTATDALADAPKSDAASDAGLMYTLTINDYINWCAVSVNGGDASTMDPQTFQFPPDASVSLHGDTASSQSFYWGYFQSANLVDGGKDTNMNVTIQMNGNVNVLACCPINNTPLSCP